MQLVQSSAFSLVSSCLVTPTAGDGQILYIKEPGMQSDMLSMTNARRYGKYVYHIDGDEIMEPTMGT